MAEETILLTETKNGVGIITLNRPDKLNAWTPAMQSSVKRAVTSEERTAP